MSENGGRGFSRETVEVLDRLDGAKDTLLEAIQDIDNRLVANETKVGALPCISHGEAIQRIEISLEGKATKSDAVGAANWSKFAGLVGVLLLAAAGVIIKLLSSG